MVNPQEHNQIVSPEKMSTNMIVNDAKHNCPCNYSGSSGAMESDGMLFLMKRLHTIMEGAIYYEYIVSHDDIDTTTNYGGDSDGDGNDDEIIDREMQLVQNISDRLETGLDEFALRAILDLLKRGEQPDAIVAVVMSLAQRPTR